jgi:hypothetical protein
MTYTKTATYSLTTKPEFLTSIVSASATGTSTKSEIEAYNIALATAKSICENDVNIINQTLTLTDQIYKPLIISKIKELTSDHHKEILCLKSHIEHINKHQHQHQHQHLNNTELSSNDIDGFKYYINNLDIKVNNLNTNYIDLLNKINKLYEYFFGDDSSIELPSRK